jgi:hypothetical protein
MPRNFGAFFIKRATDSQILFTMNFKKSVNQRQNKTTHKQLQQ